MSGDHDERLLPGVRAPLVGDPRPDEIDPSGAFGTAGLVASRYDARDGTAILLRPDQHVAARWRLLDAMLVRAAVARATCND